MKKVAVVGTGNIGGAIIKMLMATEDYHITAIDKTLPYHVVAHERTSISDMKYLNRYLTDQFAVINAAPHHLTVAIANAASDVGCHYLDLTEDINAAAYIKGLAAYEERVAFIPQCGLAPGFVSILAAELMKPFDTIESVKIRVGALPQSPTNALKYNLTWSTDGLINEYCQPCNVIIDGTKTTVPALEGLEELHIDGVQYEAFNTSGGIGTLTEFGHVPNMNYKTIRYPGHCQIMKVLLNDLGLRNRRDVLIDIFENSIPRTKEDVVIIHVNVKGYIKNDLVERTIWKKINSNSDFTAIQLTTAASVCAVLDMLTSFNMKGFVCQEDINYNSFLSSRFGKIYQ
jgi:saccharopine dehydrogenase-like NADP-dependent oxidoreductase